MSGASSVAAVIVREGRFFVARRVFGGPLGGLWEFPGGKLEEGESEEEALVREFQEEFGVDLIPQRSLGETTFLNKGRDRRLVAWLAELPLTAVLDLREHQTINWVSYSELLALDIADSDRKLFPFLLALL